MNITTNPKSEGMMEIEMKGKKITKKEMQAHRDLTCCEKQHQTREEMQECYWGFTYQSIGISEPPKL